MEHDTRVQSNSSDYFPGLLHRNAKFLIWALIFIGSGVLLFWALPGEPKFKYEFQKGTAWRHESLIAPFDFAVLKSTSELEKELREQQSSVVPYFECDTSVSFRSVELLRSDLKSFIDDKEDPFNEISADIVKKLRDIYSAGILQRSTELTPELKGKEEVKKRVGVKVYRTAVSDLYSEKTAYNSLKLFLQDLKEKNPDYSDIISGLNLENYIFFNLSFDSETTKRASEEVSKQISQTRGMVHAGDQVILEGEIVTDEKYQILESLKSSFEKEHREGFGRYSIFIGKSILLSVFFALIFLFLFIYRPDILDQYRKLLFLMIFITGTIIFTLFIDSFPNLHIYIVPFAIFPIIVRTFFDSRSAIFTLVITSLIIGFYASNSYEYVLVEVVAGVVAVFSLNKMHRRSHLVRAAVFVFLAYALVYTMISLIHEGTFRTIQYNPIQWFFVSSLLILLVYPLIFIFEKIFGFISDVTLIELSDTNQPLLRKLAEEAPGTFHHSIQIANLSEEIILKIGGNPFLVRAGALYHDIGKTSNPEYFIENQVVGLNPHDNMDYLNSAKVIISHVENGIKLAKKHNLPDAIIEFIATHHGTTKAKYFYLKHQEDNPNDIIDDQPFIYPGPLPRTKEAAVVMLVDGVEAASRSLQEKSFEKLKVLIEKLIEQKIADNQLEEADITFGDIKIIKDTLLNKLKNIYHARIEYPKEKNEVE